MPSIIFLSMTPHHSQEHRGPGDLALCPAEGLPQGGLHDSQRGQQMSHLGSYSLSEVLPGLLGVAGSEGQLQLAPAEELPSPGGPAEDGDRGQGAGQGTGITYCTYNLFMYKYTHVQMYTCTSVHMYNVYMYKCKVVQVYTCKFNTCKHGQMNRSTYTCTGVHMYMYTRPSEKAFFVEKKYGTGFFCP